MKPFSLVARESVGRIHRPGRTLEVRLINGTKLWTTWAHQMLNLYLSGHNPHILPEARPSMSFGYLVIRSAENLTLVITVICILKASNRPDTLSSSKGTS